MLAFNVRFGDTVELDHERHGPLGNFRVEKIAGAGTGTAMRIIFNMPTSIRICVLNHRQHEISFGLDGEPRGPLKEAAV
jgi:hypothetical protein